MRPENEVQDGLDASERYFQEKYGDVDVSLREGGVIKVDDFKKGVEKIIVATEICTLKWVLKKGGALNCLEESD